MNPQLSAFLIVKNEARDLPGCLDRLKGFADEIVVVDDHSQDDTQDIARRYGATVLVRSLDGFGAQKQFALDHTHGAWAFSIDADERVSPALAQEIKQIIQSSQAADGYEIRRHFYFLGQRLRFGGVGSDWVLRLFKRTSGTFSSARVHERILVRGAVRRLQEPLDHFSYATLQEYLDKCNHYTTLAAREQFTKGRRFSSWDHLRPGWELFLRVGLRGAWLDGQAGLMYAALSAHASWLRAVKLWEMQHE